MVAFVAILLGLVLVGAPLFVIIGAVTTMCFVFFTGDHTTVASLLPITQQMENLLNKEPFLAIPLFMASGAIMSAGGIAERLVNVFRAALGWLPGGMAVASVAACVFFAAISGSSPVTLIAVGSIMFPAMLKARYPENFSLGLVTTAGSLGCLVPPSIALILYSASVSALPGAKVDLRDLFLAGPIVALFIGGALILYSIVVGLKIPGPREKFSFPALRKAFVEGIWALLLPVVVMGGIYGGFYNPSAAGAIAAVYALFVTVVIHRELTFKKLTAALADSASLMGALILIIALSFGLNEFLADIKIQDTLMGWIREANLGPIGFMLLVNVILIILGALMDSISCTLIFAPMLAPVASELYGIDPLHFGVVFVVNMEIGYLMPPVATNLFVSAAVFKKPFGQVVKSIWPTLGITCAALVLIMYVPTISKGAVNAKHGRPVYEPFPWDGKAVNAQADDVAETAEAMGAGIDFAAMGIDAAPGAPDAGAVADPDEDSYGLDTGAATGGGAKPPAAPAPEEDPSKATTSDF